MQDFIPLSNYLIIRNIRFWHNSSDTKFQTGEVCIKKLCYYFLDYYR